MNVLFRIYIYLIVLSFLITLNSNAQIKSKISAVSSVTYAVVSIPYSPCSFTTSNQILAYQDDIWSTPINIGFNFDYFGKAYNSFIIGVNGQISFSTSLATGYDAWNISSSLPNASNMPGNTICAAFRDIDPTSSGGVYYSSYGSTPNRYMVISWDSIPLFATACSNVLPRSIFQLLLHETTNCIDVFIRNSSSCSAWNGGYGIIGIQDSTGTVGYSPPGRNYPSIWTTTNEGWRFIPSGSSCATACGVPTSIDNIKKNSDFEIYPNPSNGIYNFRTKHNEGSIVVINLFGEEMHYQQLNSRHTEIDLRSLNSGIYYLKFISKEGTILNQAKIVKE